MNAPTLVTQRLRLRPHRAADLADCVTLWQDDTVTRFTSRRPLDRQEVWTRLLRHPGHWALLGFGYWAVEDAATGRFVGEVGFADWRRDLLAGHPEVAGVPEAGWVTLPDFHGRGLAREALTAALAWRDANVPGAATFCLIDPGNGPSLSLAAHLGFRLGAGAGGSAPDGSRVLWRVAGGDGVSGNHCADTPPL